MVDSRSQIVSVKSKLGEQTLHPDYPLHAIHYLYAASFQRISLRKS